jgi:hypothetical protein
MQRTLLSLAALVGTAALPLAAQQDACGFGTLKRTAGTYAQYKVTGGRQAGEGTLRLAFLGTEQKDGKTYERIEMQMNGMGGRREGPVAMQMLVPGWPFDSDQIGEIVMQPPGQPAMRMPSEMMGMMRQRGGMPGGAALQLRERCGDAKLVGSERVTVAAGTFETKHFRSDKDDADFWVAESVDGFGLVKATGKDGTMELVGKGSDAKSSITGEVMDMGGMMGPGMGPGRRPRP